MDRETTRVTAKRALACVLFALHFAVFVACGPRLGVTPSRFQGPSALTSAGPSLTVASEEGDGAALRPSSELGRASRTRPRATGHERHGAALLVALLPRSARPFERDGSALPAPTARRERRPDAPHLLANAPRGPPSRA